MTRGTNDLLGRAIPEGFLAIPIHPVEGGLPLRLCVLVRQAPDPVSGYFLQLRELADGRVYLGCVADATNCVREWVEVWVQNTDGLEGCLPALHEAFSNYMLDQRWGRESQMFIGLDAEAALCTGCEEKHPRPVFIDLNTGAARHPGDGTDAWELCQDDQALERAGLPAYSRSLSRYLWQPKAGANGQFVPVTAGAPANAKTASPDALGNAGHLPLNPQGGLLRASTFSPLSFEDYVDLLRGKPWAGLPQGKRPWLFEGVYPALAEESGVQGGGGLLLGSKGRAGRFAETFHLRLQLLAEMVRRVRAAIERQQLPFLNLGADSFRVRLQPVGTQLPFLWTARVSLVKPSEAYSLPVESSGARYFVRARGGGTSIYLPEGISASLRGAGSVRLRQILSGQSGGAIVEGTLVVEERGGFSPHDLFWIRLPLAAGRVELYGHLYAAQGLASGEVRFRTIEQNFSQAVSTALKAAEGAAFPRSPFEVLPLLSSPCDLYSLGVLGARALLVNEENTLAIALDELLSLGRQVAAEYSPEEPIGRRVRAVMEKDARFVEALGPHRLAREELEPKEAFAYLPEELWYDTLGTLVRLFPGLGPDSLCKDFGDAPALALETVFNQALSDLEKLLVRSRSLILIDWTANREIRSIITSRAARAR
jgi:hypothetical protein